MSAPFFTYVTVADAVVFVKVPTAKLNVAAVDGRGKPADICRRGEAVRSSRPPKDVEVLYYVDVIAIARWGTARVRLAPGGDGTITVTVPGTIGIDERGQTRCCGVCRL